MSVLCLSTFLILFREVHAFEHVIGLGGKSHMHRGVMPLSDCIANRLAWCPRVEHKLM